MKRIYARVVLGALRPGRPKELPERELRLDGVTVDRAHLAGYDRVCGFRLSDALPATYPHVLAFPLAMALMTAADFPFPLLGLVHVANRIEVRRPLLAADVLSLSVRAESLRSGAQLDVFESLDLRCATEVGEHQRLQVVLDEVLHVVPRRR